MFENGKFLYLDPGGWIALIVGIAVSLWTFWYTLRRQRSVNQERRDRINNEVVKSVTKIFASLRDQLKPTDIQIIIESKCRAQGFKSGDLMSVREILDESYAVIIDNEYIPKDDRVKIRHEIEVCKQLIPQVVVQDVLEGVVSQSRERENTLFSVVTSFAAMAGTIGIMASLGDLISVADVIRRIESVLGANELVVAAISVTGAVIGVMTVTYAFVASRSIFVSHSPK